MNRRGFIGSSLALGALVMSGKAFASTLASGPTAQRASLAVVGGTDPFAYTTKAIELLGGIQRFAKPGQKVGLLVNSPPWWSKPGSFASPEVVLAVVAALAEAGVSEIQLVIDLPNDFLRRSTHAAAYEKAIALVRKNAGQWRDVDVPKGKVLHKAKVNATFLDCDVLVNVPIAKHHAGTGYTGALKNVMGACHRSTNKSFHEGPGKQGEHEDVGYLSQCIADANTLRRPDLVVCDATEFLLTNGPGGPGELRRANKVVAGADAVAVDAYACSFVGRKPSEVQMLAMAEELGVGHQAPASPGLVELSL